MRAVNLLPVDSRAGRRGPPAPALAVAGAGVLATSLLAVGFITAHGSVGEREKQLAVIQQDVEAVKRRAQPRAAQTGVGAERDQRFTALSDALAKRLAWDRVLREVSLVMPEDVWLSGLAAGGGGATESPTTTSDTSTGQAVTFNGFTYSQEGVARMLTRLALVPDLSDVKLQKSTVQEVGSQQIYGFTILADIVTAGGTP